jgi:hypothetical protein
MIYRTGDGENLWDFIWNSLCGQKLYLRNKLLPRMQYKFNSSEDYLFTYLFNNPNAIIK